MGGQWDRFALANDGDETIASLVSGRPLWSFIRGGQTVGYLNAIFFHCREWGAVFADTYRCDGPKVSRLHEIAVYPQRDGTLMVGHVEIGSLMPSHSSNGTLATKVARCCSVCCRFETSKGWIDPLNKEWSKYSPVQFAICQCCKDRANDRLAHDTSLWATKEKRSECLPKLISAVG